MNDDGSSPTQPTDAPAPAPTDAARSSRASRPIVERVGLAAIAFIFGALFGTVAAASFSGGEPFLGLMGVIGCAMTMWVGIQTLVRG
jgi:hypothetical protein